MAEQSALEAALRFISRHSYSILNLKERLVRAGFSETEVHESISRLIGWGYLNDREFGADRIDLLKKRLKSRAYVEQDLLAQGLGVDLVAALLEEFYPTTQEVEIAQRLLGKKSHSSSAGEWQKLVRAGFSEDTVRQCFPEISSP